MFRFKQFTIHQDRCPMKVGTDGVLLGAWTAVRLSDLRILDIGTGTGLIALMLAQRAPEAVITGVDVDDVSQARANADASPWGDRLNFVQTPVQVFSALKRFDLIVSNPPFFVDLLTCPDPGRTTARHAVSLPFEELRDAVFRLLADDGHFSVILPVDQAARFISICQGQLTLTHHINVRTTPRHPVKRVLMEFMRETMATGNFLADDLPLIAGNPLPISQIDPHPSPHVAACSELVIGTGCHEEYTPEYRALTRDFYLKF